MIEQIESVNAVVPLPEDFDQKMLDAFLWGNMRFPQGGFGVTVNFAHFIIEEGVDLVKFVERTLSEKEFQ